MGEIGGERISAMEWSTENRAGLGVGKEKTFRRVSEIITKIS